MTARPGGRSRSLAFLLAQVGGLAADEFERRLGAVELTRAQAGVLRALAMQAPVSQQALAAHLEIAPSRLVVLVDELEGRGIVERRADAADRRVSLLHLTGAGRDVLERLARIAREHDQAFCASLSEAERAQLAELLEKLATAHALRPGVHPGYRRMSAPAAGVGRAGSPKRR